MRTIYVYHRIWITESCDGLWIMDYGLLRVVMDRQEISHVMRKMIIDNSAFLFNQREKGLPFTEYFAL